MLPAAASTWFSSFGRLTLTRDGSTVRGRYEHGGGSLEGALDGSVLRGRWTENEGKTGPVEITFDVGGNTFRGSWRYDADEVWRGVWNGVVLLPPSDGEERSFSTWNAKELGPVASGPMVGEVGDTDARIWIQARDEAAVELVVEGPDGFTTRVLAAPSREQWLCVTMAVAGLRPSTRYRYRVESALGKTEDVEFTTLPSADARKLRVAFGSCYDAHEHPLPIFDSILRDAPDVMLMIGDNCYYMEPDWQTEHTMMLAQLRNRNNPSFTALGARIPVLAIWDDHDFGPNDSDGRFELKPASLRVFERCWAQKTYGSPEQLGIFSTVRCGPVEMFLLDGRYERLNKTRILGDRQMAWFEQRLLASTAPVKLIVSGSQVLPVAAVEKDWECWRLDAPDELEHLLAFVAERNIPGVVYVSGDVHLGYLLHEPGRKLAGGRVGPETWELTASPLSNDPWHETILSPGQPYDPTIVGEFPAQNYGFVDVDLDRAGSEIILTLKDAQGGALIERAIDLRDLSLETEGARPRVEPERAKPVEPIAGSLHPDRMLAVLRRGDTIHFLRGTECIQCSADPSSPLALAKTPLHHQYRGATARGINAAVSWPNGKAYFFAGPLYYRFDLTKNRVDAGWPLKIADHWPGVFDSRVDAALVWDAKKAFFFSGSEYVRYDIEDDKADPGYPQPIAKYWKGVWPDGFDAALGPIAGKAYFFRGSECIRYDVEKDCADSGYPKPTVEVWPALAPPSIA